MTGVVLAPTDPHLTRSSPVEGALRLTRVHFESARPVSPGQQIAGRTETQT